MDHTTGAGTTERATPNGAGQTGALATQIWPSANSLIGLTLGVPDNTTVIGRAAKLPPLPEALPTRNLHVLIDGTGLQVFGGRQWLREKHGAKARRGCRKLYLALDGDSGQIVASTLTDAEADEALSR